jgi:hypothetical protein
LLNTATRVNSNGNIEVVNANIPRLDYYTTGGVAGCPALLVEPSGTNFVLQSEAWNVSPWTATSGSQGATVSGNVTTSPDGTTNADKLIEAAVTGNHFCLQTLTLTSGTTYTASCFVKASEKTRGRLRMSGSGAYWDLDFNLALGTVTGGTNPFIQNFGNGWYRIGATFTANQASNNFILLLLDDSGNNSYTGNGTSGLFVYGAQVEAGSVATSYIPTTTATVSRSADVVTLSGATDYIGQTEGTLYWEGAINRYDRVFFALASGSSTTQCVRLQTTGLQTMQFIVVSGGTIQANIQTSGAITLGQFYKAAAAYKENDFVFFLNGAQVGITDTSGTLPTNLNSVYLLNSNGTEITDQQCRAAAIYNTRLSNAELASLTTI